MTTLKISMGSDHGGLQLKNAVKAHLESLGHTVVDYGTNDISSCDYPEYGKLAAEAVANETCERGIVVCSTGIGISIAANKVKGVRCALCSDVYSAQLTRDHNDSNMLALGQNILGIPLALAIVETWIETPFSGGDRHARRIAAITSIEEKYMK